MVDHMMASMKTIRSRAGAHTFGQRLMANQARDMKDIGIMANNMDRVNSLIREVRAVLESGSMGCVTTGSTQRLRKYNRLV